MSSQTSSLLLAFYGDDFTGSTDALECMSRAGARTVLFIEPPAPEQIAAYEGVQAIGVAGFSRSLSPEAMEVCLRPAFEALKALQPRHVHYKVCSTFDSSPEIGSIGKAMEIGAEVFDSAWIPLLVAAPALGRYCAFGNLFARMGIGSQGQIHRLDRHPSMRVHPITPATESDLRLHLAKQTSRKTGLVDLLQLAQPEVDRTLQRLVKEGFETILMDALYEEQMPKIGELIDNSTTGEKPLFSVGSSGIEMALGSYWQVQGPLTERKSWTPIPNDGPILVISGSCSPVSAQQIAWAEQHGFASIDVDTTAVATQPNDVSVLQKTIGEAIDKLAGGQSVIVQTSNCNDDPRIDRATRILGSQGYTPAQIRTLTGQIFGKALGRIAKEVFRSVPLTRLVVAGGDTSSYAARAMGIEAVEMLAPLTPGAPICLAHAPGSPLDQKQIIFKGGQVGAENYYGWAAGNL
ncbi:MAG: four-carbon acid sugar kinase family protein [Spirosomataceae bacterium]